MTLPKDVADAMTYIGRGVGSYPDIAPKWQTIRAHLLSQDAEIERLRSDNDKLYREHVSLQNATVAAESRLAAADALLREISDRSAEGTDFRDLAVRIRTYVTGAGDE